MRNTSPTELELLRAGRLVYHMRAEIANASGAWIDYTDAFGIAWLREIRWSATIDRPVMNGTITLLREADGISLAPSMTGSPANAGGPAIEKGRLVRLSIAVVPPGTRPTTVDWREVMLGIIDELEYGGKSPQLVVEFRDIGARFLDTNITAERVYGSATGVDAAATMDAIGADNWATGTYGVQPLVYVPDPVGSAFAVSPAYPQRMQSLLEAYNDLAMQFGQVVRYKYDAADVFRLTLYDPQRDRTDIDATFGPDDYLDLPRLRSSRDDVRNQVRVRFVSTVGTVEEYYAEDTTSIAAFGPKFMFLGLDVASQVRTFLQAAKLADSALWDLAEPLNEHQTESFCLWPAELGDRYKFLANGRQYDVDQTLAVLGYDHIYTAPGKARTQLTTRGKIAGMGRQWRERGNVGPIPIDKVRPEIGARLVPSADGSKVDLYLTPTTTYPETLGVRLKSNQESTIAMYLCVANGDNTPRFVASGTEIGPNDWFYLNAGVLTGYYQPLKQIALSDLKLITRYVQSYGFMSGLNSDWLAVVLDQRPRPELASASIAASNPYKYPIIGNYYIKLTVTFTGGRGIGSVADIRVVDVDADPANAIVDSVNIAPGQTITRFYEITASAEEVLDKTWGAILTPNSNPLATAATGLVGFPVTVTTAGDAYQNASQTDLDATDERVDVVELALGDEIIVGSPSLNLPASRVLVDGVGTIVDRTTSGEIAVNLDPAALAVAVALAAMPPTVQFPFGNGAVIASAGDWLRGAPARDFRVVGWHVDAVTAAGAKVAIDAQFTVRLLPFAGGAAVVMATGGVAPRLVADDAAASGDTTAWAAREGVAGDSIMVTLDTIAAGTAKSLLLTLTLQAL